MCVCERERERGRDGGRERSWNCEVLHGTCTEPENLSDLIGLDLRFGSGFGGEVVWNFWVGWLVGWLLSVLRDSNCHDVQLFQLGWICVLMMMLSIVGSASRDGAMRNGNPDGMLYSIPLLLIV